MKKIIFICLIVYSLNIWANDSIRFGMNDVIDVKKDRVQELRTKIKELEGRLSNIEQSNVENIADVKKTTTPEKEFQEISRINHEVLKDNKARISQCAMYSQKTVNGEHVEIEVTIGTRGRVQHVGLLEYPHGVKAVLRCFVKVLNKIQFHNPLNEPIKFKDVLRLFIK